MSFTYQETDTDKRRRWKEDSLVRAPEVADYLLLSVRTIKALTSKGGLPHYRIGRAVRYRPSEIEAWMLSRAARKPPGARQAFGGQDLRGQATSNPNGTADACEVQDPLVGLRSQRALGDRVTTNLYELVAEARAMGCSWDQIGDALGVSRQAVIKRFKDR
jgi:excisionase family DNA binding protein